jgi:putative membrane protein
MAVQSHVVVMLQVRHVRGAEMLADRVPFGKPAEPATRKTSVAGGWRATRHTCRHRAVDELLTEEPAAADVLTWPAASAMLRIMRFLLRLAITAAALWAAVQLVPGIRYEGGWPGLFGVALVFGIVNALVRPFLLLLTCPLVVLTFGLFVFVLNGLMLLLTAVVAEALGLVFWVDDLVAAVLGALVIGIVSAVLNLVVPDARERR